MEEIFVTLLAEIDCLLVVHEKMNRRNFEQHMYQPGLTATPSLKQQQTYEIVSFF